MMGLLRADWIRFRRRRTVQFIVLAVPLLGAFIFMASYRSTAAGLVPPFDAQAEQAYRQELIDEGAVLGASPADTKQILDQMVDEQRVQMEQIRSQQELGLSRYAFPQSLLTMLGNVSFLFLGLILLAATTIGDEFSWGTIRTSLIASGDRPRLLLVRMSMLAGAAVVMLVLLLLLGVILPVILTATGASIPAPPDLNPGAFVVLLAGEVAIAATVIAFATFATVLVRSGSLTLVVALAYIAIEGATLAVLLRFTQFQPGGASEWVLKALPVRGIVAFLGAANGAAGVVPGFQGEDVVRDLGEAWLPLVAILVWGALFLALAFRRFGRMDIVE